MLRRPRLFQERLKSSGFEGEGHGQPGGDLTSVTEGEKLRLEWMHPEGENLAVWLVSQIVF